LTKSNLSSIIKEYNNEKKKGEVFMNNKNEGTNIEKDVLYTMEKLLSFEKRVEKIQNNLKETKKEGEENV